MKSEKAHIDPKLLTEKRPTNKRVMKGTGNSTSNFSITDNQPNHLYGIIFVMSMGLVALVLSVVFVCYTRTASYFENHTTLNETELILCRGETVNRARCASETDVKMKYKKVDQHRPITV